MSNLTDLIAEDQEILNRMADNGCTLADMDVVAKALKCARGVRTLDDWRQSLSGGTWTMGFRNSCIVRTHDMATGAIDREYVYDGATAHAARADAATAIRSGVVR